jgi:hypothetical protein
MKKIIGIFICMLMTLPVVPLAAEQMNPSTMILIFPLSQNVTIVDYQFIPATLTVPVGTKVIWTNNGPSIHTVTSDTGIFNSGNIPVGQKWNYTFNVAGSFPYHCAIHASMHGTITVTGANQPPNTPTEPTGPGTRNIGQSGTYSSMTTDPNGDQVQYRFDWNATGSHDISAWSALVPSGQTVSMAHAWVVAGTYVVEAQARDSVGAMSNWSLGLTVVVSNSGNTPPNTPTTPIGPATRNVGQSGSYNTNAIDPDGDQVQYRFDFDANGAHSYSSYTSLMPSGQTGNVSHIWNSSGTYVVKAQARDSVGQTSNWSSGLTVVVSTANQPPNTPVVSGPSKIKVGVTEEFNAVTSDPNGDMVEYYFDFGDGTNSGWTPMVNSGAAAHVNHSWAKKGTYTVKAKARDTSLAESAYGSVSITVPLVVSYTPAMTFLRLILERLIYLFSHIGEIIYP